MRMTAAWLLSALVLAGAAWADPPAGTPGPLHLEVNQTSLPMTRFDDHGQAVPQPSPQPTPKPEFAPVQGKALEAETVKRDYPWWAGPEYPAGPGRAWPTSWPGPRGPGGPWGPYW